MEPNFINKRHKEPFILVDKKDHLNGIFTRENEKGNTYLNASTVCEGNAYNLLKNDDNARFWTNNYENSFIEGSLKDGKSFIITDYTIRSNNHTSSNSYHLKNWIVEGKKASNDEWIQIDVRNNESFNNLQNRTFSVTCQERLKAVKLTMKGYNSAGNYHLMINNFDIFGKLFVNHS